VRHIRAWLLIIWDGLPAHRSRLVKQWLSGQAGRIEIEYPPAYAPELNPVEYIWGYCKARELPNLCPKTLSELSYYARRALRRMRRRPITSAPRIWPGKSRK
jgi:transposase